jgi:hypothetical protein
LQIFIGPIAELEAKNHLFEKEHWKATKLYDLLIVQVKIFIDNAHLVFLNFEYH